MTFTTAKTARRELVTALSIADAMCHLDSARADDFRHVDNKEILPRLTTVIAPCCRPNNVGDGPMSGPIFEQVIFDNNWFRRNLYL